MKKIIVVVDSIDVNDSSGSKANVALIHNLAAIGYDVKVYHYTQKKIELPSIECVSITELKWNVWYLLSRSQRIFTRYTKININPLMEKLFGFSFTFFNDSNSIRKALEKEKTFQPDWVLTLSKAASFRPHKALLGIPKWHDKWLTYIHDPYPAHLYPRPYNWVEPGYFKKWSFMLEISEKSKYGIFPSKLLKEWMGSYYPRFLINGKIIPHQIINNKNNNTILPSFYQKDCFSLLHAGSLMKQRNPIHILKALELFLINYPEARKETQLLFIGYNDFHKEVLNKYKNYPNIKIFEYVPFDITNKLQQNVTVNIILESKSEISPFLPGKFPHCVEANRPILLLGPYYSEIRRLLGKDYVYWSEVDDIEKICQLISNLYIIWKNKSKKMELGRPDIKEYLSIKHLKSVIEEL